MKDRVKEKDVAGGEVEDGGEVRQITDPVHPGREEAGSFAKSDFGPDGEATLGGITRREGGHGEGEGNVEKQPCEEPDDEGGGAMAGGRGDPAETDAGDDIEEDEVAKAHDARGSVFGERGGDGQEETAFRDGVGRE